MSPTEERSVLERLLQLVRRIGDQDREIERLTAEVMRLEQTVTDQAHLIDALVTAHGELQAVTDHVTRWNYEHATATDGKVH